jgi:hypothetical protein
MRWKRLHSFKAGVPRSPQNQPSASLLSRRQHGVIDIFLLRRVDSHDGLDGLDDALRVANQLPVDRLRRQILGDAVEHTREMQTQAAR